MGETIELKASDGHRLHAYVATPSGAARGGLVVIQEIFGVNGHIRDVCDRFAGEGYLAVAPALFDRAGPGVELGYERQDFETGRETRNKIDWSDALKDVAAAHDFARKAGRVGIVGFCYGGSVAWLAAARLDFDCAVSYYGGAVHTFANEKPRCPTICHIGSLDHGIGADKIAAIREARPEIPVHVYEGSEHGFNCDQRASWDAEAARIAGQRTLDLLRANVG